MSESPCAAQPLAKVIPPTLRIRLFRVWLAETEPIADSTFQCQPGITPGQNSVDLSNCGGRRRFRKSPLLSLATLIIVGGGMFCHGDLHRPILQRIISYPLRREISLIDISFWRKESEWRPFKGMLVPRSGWRCHHVSLTPHARQVRQRVVSRTERHRLVPCCGGSSTCQTSFWSRLGTCPKWTRYSASRRR